jgi:hypothetical protein
MNLRRNTYDRSRNAVAAAEVLPEVNVYACHVIQKSHEITVGELSKEQ